MPLTRLQIAQRAAQELHDGDYVNLGVGIPIMVSNFVPEGVEVVLHSGHGILGLGPLPSEAELDPDLTSVWLTPATLTPGASISSSIDTVGMVRAGKVDLAIMGGMQVSEQGDLANWTAPGMPPVGMGGAMDLAVGAQRLVVTMEHVTRKGERRILNRCTFPLTGVRCVDRIITDYAVIDVTSEGLRLVELAPGVTADEVQAMTEPTLIVGDDVVAMQFS